MSDVRINRLRALESLISERPEMQLKEFAARIDVAASHLSQWRGNHRTISEESARKIEKRLRLPTGWMDIPRDRRGEMTMDHHLIHQSGDIPTNLSGVRRQTPEKIKWGDLAMGRLPAEFETELSDQSMAPDAPLGTRCLFVVDAVPEAGDWVLVRDKQGGHHLREYRQTVPGQWLAVALNSAFLPLDPVRDGIEVVAVFDGMRGRRSRR